MAERLQKFLARMGLGSRRQIEDWIRQGRITVNGAVAQLGHQVNGAEKIQIDGRLIQVRPFGQRRRVLAYYKPVGEMTSRHDPEWLEAFARGVASIDEVIECHRMAGDVDYLLKLVVRDIAHYDRIYRKLIAAVPDLADVSSSFSMERMKHTTALPRPV